MTASFFSRALTTGSAITALAIRSRSARIRARSNSIARASSGSAAASRAKPSRSSRAASTSVIASSVAERGCPSKNASSPTTAGASICLNADSLRGRRTPSVPSVIR